MGGLAGSAPCLLALVLALTLASEPKNARLKHASANQLIRHTSKISPKTETNTSAITHPVGRWFRFIAMRCTVQDGCNRQFNVDWRRPSQFSNRTHTSPNAGDGAGTGAHGTGGIASLTLAAD